MSNDIKTLEGEKAAIKQLRDEIALKVHLGKEGCERIQGLL